MNHDPAVERALATIGIGDALMRGARGVDRLDRKLMVSAYHPGARDNHGSFDGPVEEWADWVIERHTGNIPYCSHFLGNSLVRVEGDRARAETYNVVAYRSPDSSGGLADMLATGRYVDSLELRDGGWRISERMVVFEDDRLDPVAGRVRFESGMVPSFGRRDGSDPSYGVLCDMTRAPKFDDPVDYILSRIEIRDALMRYCRGLDRRDRSLLLSAFHDNAQIRFEADSYSPSEIADRIQSEAAGWVFSNTFTGNELTWLDGDRAQSESYFIHTSRQSGEDGLADTRILGRFADVFERCDGTWRMTGRTIIVDQDRIDPVGEQWDDPMKPLLMRGKPNGQDYSYQLLGDVVS